MYVRIDPAPIRRAARNTGLSGKAIYDATTEALTVIALRARKAEEENAKNKLDRITPFAARSFVAKKASVVNGKLESKIYVKAIMESIYNRLEHGGIEPRGFGIALTSVENKYGSLDKNYKAKILRTVPNSFEATINNTRGIFRRESSTRNLLLVVAYLARAQYDPMLGYTLLANHVADTFADEIVRQIDKRLKAIRS